MKIELGKIFFILTDNALNFKVAIYNQKLVFF